MVQHKKLLEWVEKMAALLEPDSIYWCNGSEEENERLLEENVAKGAAVRLNREKRPGCYLFRSDPSDVARVEGRTFIASESEDDAGPTNNWIDPTELKETMRELYRGAMKGRTMYVIPFSMGPLGSPAAKIRHRTDRQLLRRNEHAHHDAHGQRGPRSARRGRRIRSVPPLRRRTARAG